MRNAWIVAAMVSVCVSGVRAQVVIETVLVGDAGNAPDDEIMWSDGTTGYGGVDYEYHIGKYEVTNAQYVAFLNAVAASDPHTLYSTFMSSAVDGGVTRSGSDGSYTYAAIAGRENMPVNHVCFLDTLRFANWMQHSQPTGAGDASTTEDGASDSVSPESPWTATITAFQTSATSIVGQRSS